MKFCILLTLCLACGGYGSPVKNTTALRLSREFDLLANTRNMINETLANLGKAIQKTNVSVETFRTDVTKTFTQFNEKVDNEGKNLRRSIEDVITQIFEMIGDAAQEVLDCAKTGIQQAQDEITQNVQEILECGEELINNVLEIIEIILNLLYGSREFSGRVQDELNGCYNTTSNDIFSLAKCVGSIAAQVEMKSSSFFAQSALLVGRINYSLLALPARLDLCAAQGLFPFTLDLTSIALQGFFQCVPEALVEAAFSDTNSSNSTCTGN